MRVSRVALSTIFVGDLVEICKPGHCKPYVPPTRWRRFMEWLRIVDKQKCWGVAETTGKKGDIISIRIMGTVRPV